MYALYVCILYVYICIYGGHDNIKMDDNFSYLYPHMNEILNF